MPAAYIDLVRRFNRFYTKQIGLLSEGLLRTPYSLTQARLLYELGSRPGIRSTELIHEVGLDAGYLSRLLKGFERQGLLKRTRSRQDRRAHLLALTAAGRAEFELLNARSQKEIGEMLEGMSEEKRQQLADSMSTIRQLLDPRPNTSPAFAIRTHRPGDVG